MTKEYILYEGKSFTIEWYYDASNKSKALEYFDSLSDKQKDRFLYLVKALGDVGNIDNKEKLGMKETKFMLLNLNPIGFYVFSIQAKKL